ncbi:MAG: alanine racemase [Candidatus Polarisedimenticolaceae bacterium]|nr:alanine racemase [Candidatus Polarisedimenticolaceae bacterium]
MQGLDSGLTPWVTIDHAALRFNLDRVRRATPDSAIWAVIKADAYGHGMVSVAATLCDADGFAVARLDEALRLRGDGITKPILLLEGVYSTDELRLASRARLEIVLHHSSQLAILSEADFVAPLTVWLKLDTGMHRLGFDADEFAAVLQQLQQINGVDQIGLMTHLANADDRKDPATQQQLSQFDQWVAGGEWPLSCANSAGILGFPASHHDWVRPGIMLYGASPFTDSTGLQQGLKPVMTLRSSLISTKQLQKGDRIGYGGTYACPEAMPIGVVGIGYGDGYPRHAKTGTPVLINGQLMPLIGRVSMDMITVDLRQLPNAKVGDDVILWGEGLPVELIAESADTIPYELFCGVTQRVKRVDLSLNGECG